MHILQYITFELSSKSWVRVRACTTSTHTRALEMGGGSGSPVAPTEKKRERSPVPPEECIDEESPLKRPATAAPTTSFPSAPTVLGASSFHNTTVWAASQPPHLMENTAQRSAFEQAAEEGAREAQQNPANAAESFSLGVSIVRRARLSAAQRRSSRVLPGGGDTTTAACHALGGTSDSILNVLASAVSPTQPRDTRLKAVERTLKTGIRASIVRLNGGDASRDVRACNLAAVRICTSVADILAAYSAQCLVEDMERARAESVVKDATIAALQAQLEERCNCGRG